VAPQRLQGFLRLGLGRRWDARAFLASSERAASAEAAFSLGFFGSLPEWFSGEVARPGVLACQPMPRLNDGISLLLF